MKIRKNDYFFNFRLPKELFDKVEEFANMLEFSFIFDEFPYAPKPVGRGGFKSLVIRLCIEDTINRYMGPKDDPDEIICPYADEMSRIYKILKDKKLRDKLEEIPKNIPLSEQKEMINEVIKKFA